MGWRHVQGQKGITQELSFFLPDFIALQSYTVLYGALFDTDMMLEEHDLYECLHSVVFSADCLGTEQDCHSCN